MVREFRLNNFVIGSLGEAYPNILDTVMRRGYRVESRIGGAMNLQNVTIVLTDPSRSLVVRKGMSIDFAVEETAQSLAGIYDHARLAAVNKRAAELITLDTAYGPRVATQLPLVEAELRANPNSRRAVVYVGRHDDLYLSGNANRAFEMPCTMTWQFDLSQGELDMTVNMRSNDAVWGLSYDIPMFTTFQRAMAYALDVPVGTYWHQAGSFHIYERHFDLVPTLMPNPDDVFGDPVQWFASSMLETRENVLQYLRG